MIVGNKSNLLMVNSYCLSFVEAYIIRNDENIYILQYKKYNNALS